MSSKDPITNVSEGLAKAAIEYTEERIKALVQKFFDKDISFIGNSDTIKLAKEQRKKGEWNFFKKYVKNYDFRILFQMGLTLRQLDKNGQDLTQLKDKILKKYKDVGLHIANFVQNGLFTKYVGIIIERASSIEEVKSMIEDLFNNIDKKVIFIKTEHNSTQKAKEIIVKIQAHSPEIFVMSSIGIAKTPCEEIKKEIMQNISADYICEKIVIEDINNTEDENKRVYFLIRKDQ